MKTHVNSPHDRFFKAAMSDPRVSKAFFARHLPTSIQKAVDLDSLEICNGNFLDKELQLTMTDMLFSVSFNEHPGYLYTLVEHQTAPDKLMPFRLLKYMVGIMEQHLKSNPDDSLPIVYPIIFYTGKNKYSHSTDLFNLFEDPHNFAKEIFLRPFQLVDLSQIPDKQLKQEVWLGIMEMCMKHRFARDILPHLQDMLSLFQQAEKAEGGDYLKTAFKYLLTVGETKNSQVFLEAAQKSFEPTLGDNIMTIAEQLRQEGLEKGLTIAEQLRQEGLKQGHMEGVEEGQWETKKNIARKLLAQGMSINMVSELTDLPVIELKTLTSNNPSQH